MSLDAMKHASALICSARLCEVNSMSSRREMLRLMIEATDILRAAIEQALEPVAWVVPSWLNSDTRLWESQSFSSRPIKGWLPLYTATLQWQGLTDDEIAEIAATPAAIPGRYVHSFARAIEAKLKEKNT